MRPRDLDRLEAATYDVLVVGGGIHGLALAYEAASRGLRTALVEAGDFGSGASFNHQKTAHGGLRSLQSGRLDRARDAIRERRALARIAPWLLRPLPFLVGTYRSFTRSRLALRTAFAIDAWLGRGRNTGVEPELHLPVARLISKAATLRLFPGIRHERLTGGAQWYDYQIVESDRLTVAFASAADRAGADLANYAEGVAALRDGSRIVGMRVRDRVSGREIDVRAAVSVNVAGGAVNVVRRMFGVTTVIPLLKAMNLVTSKAASDIALAAPGADGRMLTLVPWRGRALVGTSHSERFVGPHDTQVTAGQVDAFIARINEAFPALKLARGDVTLVHRGIVPARQGRDGQPDLRPEPEIHDHAKEGVEGAFTIVGVKYTSARGVAERAVERIARRLRKSIQPSRSATAVLPGAGIADHEALAIETARAVGLELPLPVIRHLIARYAEAAAAIITLMAERREWRAPVGEGTMTVGAEVVYALRQEMAVHLTDVVIRRTSLGAAGHPGPEVLQTCAWLAAGELGWDRGRTSEEIAAVDAFYRIH
ncbi:MAG TPA: FAD-dependent oxidoreductase [Vicinamibacterales bacterium]|nr:FAD-dependent oxidoreductase [Vicinamibacterales bacterium]